MDLRARIPPPIEVATLTDCIHLAAVLFPVSSAAFFHDNIPITRNIVSALARHAPSLQRFVHVSSLAARGPGASADYKDAYLDARAVSNYGESKYACETVARSLLPERVHVAILRPGIVLSRDDHRLLLTAKNLRWTPSSVLARLPSAMSAVAVEDLSQAIIAALASQPPLTGVFEIGHPEPVRVQEIAGRGARRDPEASLTPSWLMKTIAAAATAAARLTGAAPLLTFDKLREMQHASWCTDSTAFTAATGWQPSIHPMKFLQPYLR
jgi:nucleoside-diphosphate-sugar epimerase